MSDFKAFLASVHRKPENRGGAEEQDSFKSTMYEPFVRYTKDPFAKSKSPRPRISLHLPKRKSISVERLCSVASKPGDGKDVQFNPCTHSTQVPDESQSDAVHKGFVAPEFKEHFTRYTRDPAQELRKKNSTEECDLVIPSHDDSENYPNTLRFKVMESFARYVKDPLPSRSKDQVAATNQRRLEAAQKSIQDLSTHEYNSASDQLKDNLEEVFVAFQPGYPRSPTHPESEEKGKKLNDGYQDHTFPGENSISVPPIVVFRPTLQDASLSKDKKEALSAKSLNQPPTFVSEDFESTNKMQPKQSANEAYLSDLYIDQGPLHASSRSGSKLSYFSYLGDDFTRSWSRSSTASSFMNLENQVSSASSSNSPEVFNKVSSPKSTEFQDLESSKKFDQIIDFCTCMCCVKAVFYHCTKDNDCGHACDDPAYCDQPNTACVKRWGFLSLLTCCMPCLLFYAPLKGLQKAAKRTRRFFKCK